MNINPYIFFLLLAVVISAFAQILLKKAATKTYKSVIFEYLNPYVICGYGIMVLGMLLNVVAFTRVDYKNGPVIDSLGFLFVMILSNIFFKEKITKKKVIGNAIILIGILIFYM